MQPLTPAPAYQHRLQQFCQQLLADSPALAPYSNNYRAGHRRALANNFPLLCRLLGEDIFNALAQAYLQHYPPRQWDLNRYGGDFADLVAAQRHGAKAAHCDWASLARIARLEYAIIHCYYADPQHGIAGPVWLPCSAQAPLPATVPAALLRQHPYLAIDQPLSLQQPIAVYRHQLRIWLANRLPDTDNGR